MPSYASWYWLAYVRIRDRVFLRSLNIFVILFMVRVGSQGLSFGENYLACCISVSSKLGKSGCHTIPLWVWWAYSGGRDTHSNFTGRYLNNPVMLWVGLNRLSTHSPGRRLAVPHFDSTNISKAFQVYVMSAPLLPGCIQYRQTSHA